MYEGILNHRKLEDNEWDRIPKEVICFILSVATTKYPLTMGAERIE